MDSDMSIPTLTTGITGALSQLAPPPFLFLNGTMAAAAASPAILPTKRQHRSTQPAGDSPLPKVVAYNIAVGAMMREARTAVQDAAANGTLTVDSAITNDQLMEMVADQSLMKDAIGRLKKRLNTKIREQELLDARIRMARAIIKKRDDAQFAALLTSRHALMRQRSEDDVARADPMKDLTKEGIESNPGPGMDDLIRVILIPETGIPIEMFINVPDSELDEYPHAPSIQGVCGTIFFEINGLLLFGSLPDAIDNTTRTSPNLHLSPLFQQLLPRGSYLLVNPGGNVPDEITTVNLAEKLAVNEQWEEDFIFKHDRHVARPTLVDRAQNYDWEDYLLNAVWHTIVGGTWK